MVIPERITNKVFATKVLDFILDELCYLRKKFEHGDEQQFNRPDEQKYIPFYQCIGKAATLFAVMFKDKVKLTLLQNRRRFSESALVLVVLDEFVNNFSSSFFQRVDSCPKPWFPVIVLMYCGVFGAIADVCRNVNRPDLVDVCRVNLELDMRSLVENIQVTCGWRSLYDTSCVYAGLYDTKFWKDDSDEEQAQGLAQVVQELVQKHAEEPVQLVQELLQEYFEEPFKLEYSEELDQVVQEHAKYAEEPAYEAQIEQAQEQVEQVQEPVES